MSDHSARFDVVEGKRPNHYDEGCTIRHGLGGTEVLKYKRKRGYFHKNGVTPVSVETAKLAGFDVEADERAWNRQEFMAQARAAADQAYASQLAQIEAKHPDLNPNWRGRQPSRPSARA